MSQNILAGRRMALNEMDIADPRHVELVDKLTAREQVRGLQLAVIFVSIVSRNVLFEGAAVVGTYGKHSFTHL